MPVWERSVALKLVYRDWYNVNEFGCLEYICSLSSLERQPEALKIKLSPSEQQQLVFIKLYSQNNQLGPIKSTKRNCETLSPISSTKI